ncbi:GL25379, partial [Drosophila persimilis]
EGQQTEDIEEEDIDADQHQEPELEPEPEPTTAKLWVLPAIGESPSHALGQDIQQFGGARIAVLLPKLLPHQD